MRIDVLRNLSFRRRWKIVHRPTAPPPGPFSRKSFPIWIDAPPYDPLSGGGRAMNLLCFHLNRLGYDASIINSPRQGRATIPLSYLNRSIVAQQRREGREPIVVYPEVTVGNPREARFVVRYLLNTPGLLMAGAESSYGRDDYFIDGAREHAPAGVRSFDLFMPLVDSEIYRPSSEGSPRHGFVIFTNRAAVDQAALPDWLDPRIVLSMKEPRTHAELGTLYRQSRAMVTFERTSAIFEALSCGCPIICIGNEHFNEATYQPRFRDGGLIWGWHEDQLEQAADKTVTFRAIYRELEHSLDERVQAAFDWILHDVWRRAHTGSSAP
jgi:hypothetical protein